jgi:PAS domain S-box-containing protein
MVAERTAELEKDIIKRQQAEETARKSEKQLRELTDTLPQSICDVNRAGVITYANQSAFRHFGYTEADFADSLHIIDMIVPHDRSRAATMSQAIMQGDVQEMRGNEYTALRKDGSTFPVLIYSTAVIESGKPTGLRILILDITEHKQAEEALQQEKNFASDIINSLPGIFFLYDDQLRLIQWNKAHEEKLGYSPEELKHKSALDFFDEEDREKIASAIQRIFAGEEVSIETTILTKDGRAIPYLFSGIGTKPGNKPHFLGTGIDISSLKETEEALQAEHTRFVTVMDALGIMVYVADMETCEIFFANNNMREKFGSGAALEGRICWETLQHDQSGPCPFCTNDKLLGSDGKPTGPYIWEFKNTIDGKWYECRDQAIRWPDGRMVRIEIATDISSRKQVESERVRLISAIEQAGENFVITDAEATIQYVNPAFERITGYMKEEVIGQNPRVLQSGEHDQAFYENMWNKLLQGEVWRGHLLNKRKDGTLFNEYATISPVKSVTGEIANFVAVKRDVSREVLLEQQLQQSRKMESIGTLAGGIAHDFNNILTAILGYAELVKFDIPADSKANKKIDKVIKAGERAADLVQQILTFSRRKPQNLQPLMPSPIVKEALKMLRSSLPTTATIEEDIDFDCGFIQADMTQIHQIVLNLCTNAFQALKNEKGTIIVNLYRTEIAGEEITGESGVSAGPFIVLSVSDTGSGIDQAMIERVFEPYFSTKEVGDGTGLGLAVVHGIVKSYHGFIRVESEPGAGTSFQVYIPAMKKSIAIIEEAEKDEILPTGRERILIVDDEDDILKLYETMLRQLGYEVTATSNSQDALEKFRNHPDRFDLIITDQTMPHLSGAELAEEILKISPHMSIIICTGHSSVLSKEKALSMGIKKYVDKPVKQREFAKIVRQVLDEVI